MRTYIKSQTSSSFGQIRQLSMQQVGEMDVLVVLFLLCHLFSFAFSLFLLYCSFSSHLLTFFILFSGRGHEMALPPTFLSSISSLSFLFLFLPCLCLLSRLLSLLSLFSLSLGEDTKWPITVDVSLIPQHNQSISTEVLVSPTPPTFLKGYWWNFPVIVSMTWRWLYFIDVMLNAFNLNNLEITFCRKLFPTAFRKIKKLVCWKDCKISKHCLGHICYRHIHHILTFRTSGDTWPGVFYSPFLWKRTWNGTHGLVCL